MSSFVQRLKALRKEKESSQEDLGKKLGIPRGTIASWESSVASPELIKIKQLAEFFNVSVDYLLGHTDTRNPSFSQEKAERIYNAIKDNPELDCCLDLLESKPELITLLNRVGKLESGSIMKLLKIVDVLIDNTPMK